MTVGDIAWFFQDLFYDLTHIDDVNLFSLGGRLLIVFIGAAIAYQVLRPLILRPLHAFRQQVARTRQDARQRQLEREAARDRVAWEAESRERQARNEADSRERAAKQERDLQARREEDEKRRQRDAEMAHERELARIRLEEQRIAAQAVSADQQREAAARIVRQLEDDLK